MADFSRRHFLFGTLLAGVIPRGGFGATPSLKALGYQSPNEKMNIAGVGAGGRAMSVLGGARAPRTSSRSPTSTGRAAPRGSSAGTRRRSTRTSARCSTRRRASTRSPSSSPITCTRRVALAAMQRGKHVYVEKPLTRTPWEARLLTEAAAKYKVATQMGNQGYSHEATRVAAEIIWSGEIGDVTEVHSFRGRASWPQGMPTLPAPEKVPDTLDWDLWLGGAAMRPVHVGRRRPIGRNTTRAVRLLPAVQLARLLRFRQQPDRRLGHPPARAGEPGAAAGQPDRASSASKQGEGRSPYTFPRGGVVIKWEFAARENMPPVTVYWSDTGDLYTPPGMTVEQMRADSRHRARRSRARRRRRRRSRPRRGGARGAAPGAAAGRSAGGRGRGGRGGGGGQQQGSGYNTVFVGIEGLSRHERTRRRRRPAARDRAGPSTSCRRGLLTRSPGHQRDWVRACKGGEPACSNFSIAGPYTEWMVLGAVAARVEGKLLWDPKKMEFTNNREANKYVKPVFRKGWELKSIT